MSSEAPPTWEQFDALYARIDRAEAALAVAREREQRAMKALRAVQAGYDAFYISKKGTAERWHDLLNAERLVRAALVNEPTAATLAEPGSREAVSQRSQQRLKPAGPPSGSASAAVDELAIPCQEPERSALVDGASAAADEPGETPA